MVIFMDAIGEAEARILDYAILDLAVTLRIEM